jgi:hypothetical protein
MIYVDIRKLIFVNANITKIIFNIGLLFNICN